MKRPFFLAILLATPLTPAAQAADTRLVSHSYKAGEVVRINARLGVQAVIAFGDDERIENVAIGDSVNWQITPNKRANLLFVKPVSARAQTNLTVVTDRYSYFFDLVAGAGQAPVYQLRFTYPDAPRPSAAGQAPALTAEESALAAGAPTELPIDPKDINYSWRRSGVAQLLPDRIFDDGRATYLSWPQKGTIPALFIVDEKGEEGPINYAVRDDVIIVDGVPPQIILRSGRSKAILERQAPVRAPQPPKAADMLEKK